jgi:aryl-alcohol dehydrogenase-like predicted oxidoreductase
MTYGEPDRGCPSWSLTEGQSWPLIRQALEAGINFCDTPTSLTATEIVLATRVRLAMRPGPNGSGLSRKAIFAEIDATA